MAGPDARESKIAPRELGGKHALPESNLTRLPNVLPKACGPLSEGVIRALTADPSDPPRSVPVHDDLGHPVDPLVDRDFQLALWMLYELHYRGFPGVPADLEWDPLLIAARQPMERAFEAAVRDLVGPIDWPAGGEQPKQPGVAVADRIFEATGSGALPELASFLQRRADVDHYRTYLARRAVYQLRESDPQSFVLPRLEGAPKAALAELQYDEYGGGQPSRLHATLFADALESLGMTTDVIPYVDQAPAATLAAVNVMSLFALNRRLRGAALGHLAAYEATSSVPCRMVALGARRLGLPDPVAAYFEEHVEADSVHEQVAVRDICGAFVDDNPAEAADVLFGVAASLAVDALAAEAILSPWRDMPEDVAQ
ncbi:iron-containing redox enzyme family protein [Nocardioides panacisoli]|uniref:Iron-containing redox enzyme family protein n=1 Tax=Nocardioides panacisoli TaxID=627624 RepID=A0ABP7HUJ2_9ACTN